MIHVRFQSTPITIGKTFSQLKGGAIALIVAVFGFAGYAEWYEIPRAVRGAFSDVTPDINQQMASLQNAVSDAHDAAGQLNQLKIDKEKEITVLIRPLTPNIHVLGEAVCGQEHEFNVPIQGTATTDWLILPVAMKASSNVETGSISDNAIFALGTNIHPRDDGTGWRVKYLVEVNYSTRSTGAASVWHCAEEGFQNEQPSRVQIVAIRAIGGIQTTAP